MDYHIYAVKRNLIEYPWKDVIRFNPTMMNIFFSPLSHLFILLIIPMIFVSGCNNITSRDNVQQPVFSFGLIADAQYADKDPVGKRFYRSSLQSLRNAVDTLNLYDLAFVAHLGDLIDQDFRSYDSIFPIYQQLNTDAYIVLGNHEYAVDSSQKSEILSRLGLSHRYYDFAVNGWRFLVLDGQGNSVFTHPGSSDAYKKAQITLADLRQKGAANAMEWNGGVDDDQMDWIKERLEYATQNNEHVIMFCHYPAYPLNHTHNIWNDQELVALVDKYPACKVYFNGHNHAGYTAIYHNMHYITLKGMVENPDENAFAIVHVYEDRLEMDGFGSEDDRIIPIKGIY